MCFGNQVAETKNTSGVSNSTSSGTTNSVATANPAVANAATSNLDFVKALQDAGFKGYTGEQVAGIDPMQRATIGAASGIANDGTGAQATSLISRYAGAPAGSVTAGKISEGIPNYMNQYVMNALAPQLRQMDIGNARDMAAVNAAATGSGAFGDARAGIEASNTRFNQNVEREGVIGNAYNQAYNTAIGASAQDVANKMSADTTTANLGETALQRALGGATALQGLQTQQLGVQTGANALAGQLSANDQARLTAAYNQWLMGQQYPFQTANLANDTVRAGVAALPASTTSSVIGQQAGTNSGTATVEKPDNSGLALGGALLSAFI